MMWTSSTESRQWSTDNSFSKERGDQLIIGDAIGKPLYGFGCCISEICVKALFGLDAEKQEDIFKELFTEEGCDFTFCRLPIGANDFAESWYSYNECDGDYEMKNFSIERDEKYLIPAILKAKKLSPQLRFFASPWSPPTWMKFPKSYNYGNIVQTEENLRAYALYFKKYLQSYKEKGIDIAQIHVQNEFHSSQKFPSCIWDGETLVTFITEYLAPQIGDETDIWYGTINGPETDHRALISRYGQFLGYAMDHEKVRQIIKGASFQWAGKFSISQSQEDYPSLDTINSEMECGDGKNTWQYAMYGYEMMHHYFRFGAKACVYWNMALDNEGYSTWGWRQNSLITVKDGNYRFTPDFYLIKHFSHFVKKGAVRLATQGSFSSNATVFRNPNGERVAVILNPFDHEKILTIEEKNYRLAPRSFNSIILEI